MASKKNQRRSERAEARAKKRRNQQITIATVIIAVIALIVIFIAARNNPSSPATTDSGNLITTSTGLQYEDLVVGTGPAAQAGDSVSVNYTGWLEDGTKFDSSLDSGAPFDFTLGTGRVIQGWDQGVAGMQVGGKRRLIIPPELAYGPQDYGPIPGGSTLTFEVELLSIK